MEERNKKNLSILPFIAFIGFFVPNGIFMYWAATEFGTVVELLQNQLAIGILIEMVAATFLVAYRFHVNPLGRVNVLWFVLFSMAGGIGFAIPMFYWLNQRSKPKKKIRAKVQREPSGQFLRVQTQA